MLTRSRVNTVTRLAFPILIALSSSLVMSLIDLAMVGTLGNSAVGAVGLASFCNGIILAFVTGMTPAVQGLVARRRGAGSKEPQCLPLNAGLLVVLAIGVPLTIVCLGLAPWFFSLISSDPQVTKIGVPFLRTLYVAIVAAGLNSAFEGFWNGIERPRTYMLVVLFMNFLNILINYVLIFGHFGAPALGAEGAAIGTAVAVHAGVIIFFVLTYRHGREHGFLFARPDSGLLKRVLEMGVPATMQGFMWSAGYIVFLWMVGKVGTSDLAAANVLVRVTMLLVLLAMSLGTASATLVARTVGEGNFPAAAAWGWDVAKIGVIAITLLGLPLIFFPEAFLSLFLTDPQTIAKAVLPLQMVGATTGAGSVIYIFGYTLYNVGDGGRVFLVSAGTQWLLFLPAVWIVGPYLNHGLLEIWYVQMGYGAIATALIIAIWVQGKWKKAGEPALAVPVAGVN
jgi:MATE family multidrug resistance protein